MKPLKDAIYYEQKPGGMAAHTIHWEGPGYYRIVKLPRGSQIIVKAG